MLHEVRRFCREQIPAGSRVICAVSGGADSMALLHCMCALASELSLQVSAAHFEHGLRGAASLADAAFVTDYCAGSGIPLHLGSGDAAARARRSGMSLEQAARALRYEYLLSLDPEAFLLTAHTADDNTETLLLNLLRGTGLRGLCGIPPVRGRILRPMLQVTRQQVLDYLAANSLPHVEDATNEEDDALRNRLRHHVIPLLRQEAPALSRKTAHLCGLLRADEDLLSDLTDRLLAEAQTAGGWKCSVLRQEKPALQARAARELLRRAGLGDPTARHVRAVEQLFVGSAGSSRADLPDGMAAVRSYDILRFEQGPPPDLPEPVTVTPPAVLDLPGGRLTLRPAEAEERCLRGPYRFAVPMADTVTVRARQPGDRILLPGGTKTVKKAMIDLRIPAGERCLLPVLTADSGLLGCVGIGPDRGAAPEERSLLVIYEKTESGE